MAFSNPYRRQTSANGLVDQMIGKSYDVVRTVFDNLGYIQTVACNMASVKNAGRNINRSIAILSGELGLKGQTVQLEMPADIGIDNLMDFNILISGSDFSIYNQASGMFTAVLMDDVFLITLANDAPDVLVNADVRLTISFRS